MRRSIQLVGLAASISAAACGGSSNRATQSGEVAQAGGPAKSDKAADEAALRALYQKMPAQLMSADTAAIGALFTDDGVEIQPGMPPSVGPAAIKKEFATTFMAMKNLKLT